MLIIKIQITIANANWDDQKEDHERKRWEKWFDGLRKLKKQKIPRCIRLTSNEQGSRNGYSHLL